MDSRDALRDQITRIKLWLNTADDMVFGGTGGKQKLVEAVEKASLWQTRNALSKPDGHDDKDGDEETANDARETHTAISKIMASTTDRSFAVSWKEKQKRSCCDHTRPVKVKCARLSYPGKRHSRPVRGSLLVQHITFNSSQTQQGRTTEGGLPIRVRTKEDN